MEEVLKWVGVIFILLVMVILLGLLMAWPFMWIWNYAVVAALSVANPITYWQAYWLSVFTTLVFRSQTSSGSGK
jgi:hypothetical protein